jgi:hypothetical protein
MTTRIEIGKTTCCSGTNEPSLIPVLELLNNETEKLKELPEQVISTTELIYLSR